MSSHISYKVRDEMTYQIPNTNGCAVEVWEWISNISHIFLGMWLFIRAGIKVKPR